MVLDSQLPPELPPDRSPLVTDGLTLKQRRFVAEYVRTGNGTQAALTAYDTTDTNTARSIASENLTKPALQTAVAAILDAGGLSDDRLAELHAQYLALASSPDPQLKAIGLRALDMAYRLKGAYAPERHRIEAVQQPPAEALDRVAVVLEELRVRAGVPRGDFCPVVAVRAGTVRSHPD